MVLDLYENLAALLCAYIKILIMAALICTYCIGSAYFAARNGMAPAKGLAEKK